MSWYTKISSKAKITSKNQKDLKCVASFTGGEDRFDVNRAAIEEHAGSDKRILEGYADFESFFPTLQGIRNLSPRQPRFLARLPSWQSVLLFLSLFFKFFSFLFFYLLTLVTFNFIFHMIWYILLVKSN